MQKLDHPVLENQDLGKRHEIWGKLYCPHIFSAATPVIICTINLYTFLLQFSRICPYSEREVIEYYETADININLGLPIEEIEETFENNPSSSNSGTEDGARGAVLNLPCSNWCRQNQKRLFRRPRRCSTLRSKWSKFLNLTINNKQFEVFRPKEKHFKQIGLLREIARFFSFSYDNQKFS